MQVGVNVHPNSSLCCLGVAMATAVALLATGASMLYLNDVWYTCTHQIKCLLITFLQNVCWLNRKTQMLHLTDCNLLKTMILAFAYFISWVGMLKEPVFFCANFCIYYFLFCFPECYYLCQEVVMFLPASVCLFVFFCFLIIIHFFRNYIF